jgi:S1-C subfamily serine protease
VKSSVTFESAAICKIRLSSEKREKYLTVKKPSLRGVERSLEFPREPKRKQMSTVLIVVIVLTSLFAGATAGYFLSYLPLSVEIHNLESQLSNLSQRIDSLPSISGNVSLPALFDRVRQSVVVVEGLIQQRDIFGRVFYTQVQGSGFIFNFGGQMIILTNYHVVAGATIITLTFVNEKQYSASFLGSNPNADLALLSTSAPNDEFSPLEMVSSSTLRVGDSVIVVGTPYGLEGSMSNGIVSALNRTLVTEEYSIGNVIQTTAPLNPGNSGGPLLNYQGQVVGIVTAIAQESQGIGFAIPSDTILQNIEDII